MGLISSMNGLALREGNSRKQSQLGQIDDDESLPEIEGIAAAVGNRTLEVDFEWGDEELEAKEVSSVVGEASAPISHLQPSAERPRLTLRLLLSYRSFCDEVLEFVMHMFVYSYDC
jgi:hypothetical protein